MAVIKMMMASLAMAAVAYALTPEEEALLAKLAAQKEAEANPRDRRAGHMGPAVATADGDVTFVVEEGKQVGIRIGAGEPLLFSEMEPRMQAFTDASLGFAGAIKKQGYDKGLGDALPIMASIPALQVKTEVMDTVATKLVDVQAAVDDSVKISKSTIGVAIEAMKAKMAKLEEDNKAAVKAMDDTMAALKVKTAKDMEDLNGNVNKIIVDNTKAPLGKIDVQIATNNKKFEALRQLPQNKYLLDGKDVSKMSLKTVTQGCSAYGPCAQTQHGYDSRRFFKVDYNPSSPGSWHDSLHQLNEGCQKLNDYLMPNVKPYGLDRKLKPVCNHANQHNTNQCITLPGTYFSHCYNKNRHCYGLDNTMLYRTVTSDSMYWGGTSLLSHDGNNNHNWRHGRNNHWRYTLCTSQFFRGTGPDVAWQN